MHSRRSLYLCTHAYHIRARRKKRAKVLLFFDMHKYFSQKIAFFYIFLLFSSFCNLDIAEKATKIVREHIVVSWSETVRLCCVNPVLMLC